MTPEQAIEIVARRAIAETAEMDLEWENFPEIGEGDWQRVLAKATELAPYPDKDECDEALILLAGRAEDEA